LAANVASGHAFCSVLRREGSVLGSVTSTDLMFAPPAGWLIVDSRLAPFCLEVFELVVALNVGANDRPEQPSTGNGDLAAATAPSEPVNVDSVNSGVVQFVGLRSKPWRSIEIVSVRSLIGTPPLATIIGTLLSRDDHLAGRLVDVELRPRDRVAEVERAGDVRHDDRQAVGRAFVGPVR